MFQIVDDDEQYSVTIDVSQFAPDDLKVSVTDGMVIIEGKHPMIKDQFGEVSALAFFRCLIFNHLRIFLNYYKLIFDFSSAQLREG